ncbi:hypothetical protein OEZ85_005178 [Tetradesmus obliquus]|uniref:TOG domain-containing protein n=1 Tax=Tetradesmus obliquus TaxID=3088 RepID=A0ABY8UIF2_TETOB|nr:hypothetical protein OEZ85_005178 [Tetradesmus obliquus]
MAMEWNDLLNQLEGQTKQKLLALDRVGAYVLANAVGKDQVSALLDMSGQLLADNNFKVALKLLNCWESIAGANRDVIRPYVNALLPHVVERLSDNRQEVRQAACNMLLELLQVLRPDAMMDKLSRFWNHKHWKVRHGLLQFVAEAISCTGEAVLAPPRDESTWVLNKVIQLVGDPESAVRDAAIECLEEVYKVCGEQLVDIISSHNLRPAHLNSIYTRLAQLGADVAPGPVPSGSMGGQYNDQSPTPSGRQQQNSAGGYKHAGGEEYDTATSGGAVCADDYGDRADVQSVRSDASPQRAPARQQQVQHAVAAENSSRSMLDGGSSKSWGAAAAGKAKRGGYKDGGGITSDGGLPCVQPLFVGCERELRVELERITSTLSRGAALVDWEKRVAALVRLEALVKGGAVGSYEDTFLEMLRPLRDPLLEQAVDRRSAVARQAAHMYEVLAAALGFSFESYAVACMGALYKAMVITVQVVSEAAEAAAKGILRHCHAPRLVPCVCDIMTGDKNAKLRGHCSKLLLQIVEEWEPLEYQRHIDCLEAALTAAVQDAMGETRTAGRAAFAAYAANMPERANALLRRMNSGLQQKLTAAVAQYAAGKDLVAAIAPVMAPPARPTSSKPWKRTAVSSRGGGGYGASRQQQPSLPNSPESCAQSEASVANSIANSAAGDGRGIGHSSGVATRLFQQPKQHGHGYQQTSGGGSLSRAASASDDLQLLNALRDQQQQQYQQQLAAQASSASVLSMAASLAVGGAQQRPATLARAIAGVQSNPKDWKDRVEKLEALAEVLQRQAHADAPAESYHEVEKVLPRLLAAVDDPHFKVSLAALATLTVCLNTAAHVMEPSLEKLMPLLFLKLCAPKQAVRSAAEGALQACALRLGPDSLLLALNRSLEAMKQPAARVSVMEFCVLFLGPGKVAGVPSSNSHHMRQWISRNIPLLLDKNPNIRQMAGRALCTMYSIDPHSVAACLAQSSSQEVLAVQRSLAVVEAAAAAEAAAAEEADEHAALAAASNAEHIATWAHRGHWGTAGGVGSTSSSMDLSTTASVGGAGAGADSAALHGITAGVAELGVSHHHVRASHRQSAAAAPAAAAPHSNHTQQQQQPAANMYQHQPGEIHSVASSPGAPAGAALHDVLGRPLPAAAFAQQAAVDAAGAAGHCVVTVGAEAASSIGRASSSLRGGVSAGGLASSNGGGAGVWGGAAGLAGSTPVSPGRDPAIGAAAAAAAAAAASGDAGSQARHLTVLVHRLQSRPGEDVLAELAACAGTMCKQAWVDNFSKVLLAGLSAAQHSSESIRELAFLLVLSLARHQAELFEPVLDVVLQPLLQGCADESREVLMAAQQALEVLMVVMPPLRCADILAHKLPSDEAVASGTAVDGEVLCATIRCLQLVCRQMQSQELMSVAPTQLLPGLFAAFNHARPDVRKAVVFAMVDLWIAAGEGLTPHLSSLSTSQLKLLTIYYNRTLASNKQQRAMAGSAEQQQQCGY